VVVDADISGLAPQAYDDHVVAMRAHQRSVVMPLRRPEIATIVIEDRRAA
jgi:hypothetical protein